MDIPTMLKYCQFMKEINDSMTSKRVLEYIRSLEAINYIDRAFPQFAKVVKI